MLRLSIELRNCGGEIFARRELLIHSTMFAKQLRLVHQGEERPPELEAALNLRSQHNFVMVPKIKRRRMTRQDAATVSRMPSSGCGMNSGPLRCNLFAPKLEPGRTKLERHLTSFRKRRGFDDSCRTRENLRDRGRTGLSPYRPDHPAAADPIRGNTC